VGDETRADKPLASIQLLITLLIHVSCAIDRHPEQHDLSLDVSLHALALHLNAAYLLAGAPYGDDEVGLREWLYERWPAPPCA
jgi:hypothetical protein